jgi:integrase
MEVAEVDWRLPLALALAESTGQRIGSILQLRRSDVDLDGLPFGRVAFRAENQKTAFEHWVPLSEECGTQVLIHLRKLPADRGMALPNRAKDRRGRSPLGLERAFA